MFHLVPYDKLFNHSRTKKIVSPIKINRKIPTRVFSPETSQESKIIKFAILHDYEVLQKNTSIPITDFEKQTITIPFLENLRNNYCAFFSILCHEVAHIVPEVSRFVKYSPEDEEIITELVAMRLFEHFMGCTFSDAERKYVHDDSRQYIKSYKQTSKTNKEIMRKFVAISKRRYIYIMKKVGENV
jgi:hypothetical protein